MTESQARVLRGLAGVVEQAAADGVAAGVEKRGGRVGGQLAHVDGAPLRVPPVVALLPRQLLM